MTSNNQQTEMHTKYANAINDLRTSALNKETILMSKFLQARGLNNYFFMALERLGAIRKIPAHNQMFRNGSSFEWIYAHNDGDSVNVSLVSRLIKTLNTITEERRTSPKTIKRKTEKQLAGFKEVASIAEENPLSVSGQMAFLKGELEKNDLVKGYLRTDQIMFYKQIIKTIEVVAIMKDLLN